MTSPTTTTRTYACEHCNHRSTGKGAAKRYNHHVIWSHTDQSRKLASGRILDARAS